jgi:hypothetical protein
MPVALLSVLGWGIVSRPEILLSADMETGVLPIDVEND